MIRSKSFASRLGYSLIIAVVVITTLISLSPIINTLALSFSSQDYALAGKVSFWPRGFTLEAYKRILKDTAFFTAFVISAKRVLAGGGLNLLFVILMAYPLSKEKKEFRSRNFYMWILIFTMLFSGGLIPWYMTIKTYGLIDKFWALVLPGAVVQFYIILLMNFFRGVPRELEEAAIIDGAGQWYVMLKIFVPVSMPAIATVTLFSVMGQWNSFFDGLILMNTPANFPLQTYIQQLILQFNPDSLANMTPEQIAELMKVSGKTFNAAKIFVTMIPILVIYPRLQRYFISGIVMGSVKG